MTDNLDQTIVDKIDAAIANATPQVDADKIAETVAKNYEDKLKSMQEEFDKKLADMKDTHEKENTSAQSEIDKLKEDLTKGVGRQTAVLEDDTPAVSQDDIVKKYREDPTFRKQTDQAYFDELLAGRR